MEEEHLATSSVAGTGKNRTKNKKKKKRKTRGARSHGLCRGPYDVADSVLRTTPWYEAAEFSRFWSHYSALMYSAHVSVLRHAVSADLCPCLSSEKTSTSKSRKRRRSRHGGGAGDETSPRVPSSSKWRPLSPTPLPRLCPQHKLQQRRRHSRPRRRCRSHRNVTDSNNSMADDCHESETQESASELSSQLRGGMSLCDDQEVPVSEEFLAFMQQTMRHKQEWALKKAALAQKNADSNALITQHGDEVVPREEHPDAVRSREMRALYGEAAPQLHAMETAVQLAFDRIATRHHAAVWPNIPLNVIFSDQ